MADYANKMFTKYIYEKDIKGNILQIHPVPDKLNKLAVLDEFFKELIDEKYKKVEINFDKSLLKIQQLSQNVMGPLAMSWMITEKANKSKKAKVEVDL